MCWNNHLRENCFKGFPFVNNLFHCKTLNSILIGNLIILFTLMCSNDCFSKTIVHVPLGIVLTYTQMLQTSELLKPLLL